MESTLDLVASVPEVYESGTASPGGGQWPINDAVKAGTLAKDRPFIDCQGLLTAPANLGHQRTTVTPISTSGRTAYTLRTSTSG